MSELILMSKKSEDNLESKMPPIPDDSQHQKPPNELDDEIESDQIQDQANILGSDSEEDQDEVGESLGYSLLPQEPEDGGGDISVESALEISDNTVSTLPIEIVDDGEDGGTATSADNIEQDESIDNAIRGIIDQESNEALSGCGPSSSIFDENSTPEARATAALWNVNQQVAQKSIDLSADKCAKITNAMAGFKLPLANQPEWARHISDEQLKVELKSRMLKSEKK